MQKVNRQTDRQTNNPLTRRNFLSESKHKNNTLGDHRAAVTFFMVFLVLFWLLFVVVHDIVTSSFQLNVMVMQYHCVRGQ